MRVERLSNILDITMGKTPARKEPNYWGKGYKWVTIRDLKQKVITETKEEITDLALKKTGIKQVAKGTLLFSFKLTIGKMAFAGTNLYTNEAIAAFVIKDPRILDSNYLYYALKSANLVGSNQAAMGKTLNSKSLAAIEIPLPDDINDQKRIAHLLGKVESLINQRKQNIQQLDDLLKSVFLDMFGDPVKNEKNWDILPCKNVVINIQSGTSYGGEDKGFLEEDELGVLKISAVTKGQLNKREFKAVKKSIIKKKLRFIKKGDLLFSRANTVELVAACCVVYDDSETLFLPDKIWALTLAEGVNIQYFNFLLKDERFRNEVRGLATGGHDSMLNISMKKFLTLDVPIPDEKIQCKFASIVAKVEIIKSQYQQSLNDLDSLYSALSQKAFKGELDLSKVPLPDKFGEIVEPNNQFTHEFITTPFTDAKPLIMPLQTHNEYPLSDPISRRQVLEYAFETFLNNLQIDEEVSLDNFWQILTLQAGDYADETDLPFNVNDYDLVKKQLFQAIADGKVEQQINMIQLKNEVTDGNQILLKKMG